MTKTKRVYVCAPYQDAPLVRAVHEQLRARSIAATSKWAELARGEEDFSRLTPDELREIAEGNDLDIAHADAVLVLSRAGAGAETYAEARLALVFDKPVVWVGRLTLSAWRTGVTRVATVDEALATLERILA